MPTSHDERPILYGSNSPDSSDELSEIWTEIVSQQPYVYEPSGIAADLSDIEPLFSLGQIVMTPGAEKALKAIQLTPMDFIHRHVRGDWGELDEEDKRANDQAVQSGT